MVLLFDVKDFLLTFGVQKYRQQQISTKSNKTNNKWLLFCYPTMNNKIATIWFSVCLAHTKCFYA